MPKSAASLAQATKSLPEEFLVKRCFLTMHATWAMYVTLNNNAMTKHVISTVTGWARCHVEEQYCYNTGLHFKGVLSLPLHSNKDPSHTQTCVAESRMRALYLNAC